MEDLAVGRITLGKVSRRLLPFLFTLFIFSYLDRSNVSVAALQMNIDLGLSSDVFGLGAGVFFLGYALFEVPSNLALARFGARLWIARIMITWGVIAVGMMFVKTPSQFYAARFLLGVAEAGFFPGVIYYLAEWFPKSHQARATAGFTIAVPLAQVLGGLIGAPLLGLRGLAGLAGWQWLFMLEGLPSIVLGIVVLFYLTDSPETASWLSPSEKTWLRAQVGSARRSAGGSSHYREMLDGLRDKAVWLLAVPYFAYYAAGFGYVAWAPLLVKNALGTPNSVTPLITAGISMLSVAAYLVTAKYSDRGSDRCGHALLGLAVTTTGCIGMAAAPNAILQLVFLVFIPISSGIFLPTFWCLPRLRFEGLSGAAPIALISSIGATGGFVGPAIIGYAKQATGHDSGAFAALAVIGIVGCAVFMLIRRQMLFSERTVLVHTRAPV